MAIQVFRDEKVIRVKDTDPNKGLDYPMAGRDGRYKLTTFAGEDTVRIWDDNNRNFSKSFPVSELRSDTGATYASRADADAYLKTFIPFDDGGGTTPGGSTTVIDALTSTSVTAALSANQGRVLAGLIEGIGERVLVTNLTNMAASGEPDGTTFFVTDARSPAEVTAGDPVYWALYQRISGSDQLVLTQNDLAAAYSLLSPAQIQDSASTVAGLVSGQLVAGAVDFFERYQGAWQLAPAYRQDDLVHNNDQLYVANGAIPASTAFTEGTTGATWKALSATVAELTQVQAEGRTDTNFGAVSGERLFQAIKEGESFKGEWALSNNYYAADVVIRTGRFWQANSNIAASTAFAEGTGANEWTNVGYKDIFSIPDFDGLASEYPEDALILVEDLGVGQAGLYRWSGGTIVPLLAPLPFAAQLSDFLTSSGNYTKLVSSTPQVWRQALAQHELFRGEWASANTYRTGQVVERYGAFWRRGSTEASVAENDFIIASTHWNAIGGRSQPKVMTLTAPNAIAIPANSFVPVKVDEQAGTMVVANASISNGHNAYLVAKGEDDPLKHIYITEGEWLLGGGLLTTFTASALYFLRADESFNQVPEPGYIAPLGQAFDNDWFTFYKPYNLAIANSAGDQLIYNTLASVPAAANFVPGQMIRVVDDGVNNGVYLAEGAIGSAATALTKQ